MHNFKINFTVFKVMQTSTCPEINYVLVHPNKNHSKVLPLKLIGLSFASVCIATSQLQLAATNLFTDPCLCIPEITKFQKIH